MELRGQELADAETWLISRPNNAPDPTDTDRAYITESRRAATSRQRRLVATLVSVAVAALALSGLAAWQWRTAVGQRDRADQATNEAVAQRDRADTANAEAQANAEKAKANAAEAMANAETARANLREAQIGQSRFLADQARQERRGDPGTAAALALEALPDNAAGAVRPYVPEAEVQLDGASRDLRERFVLGHNARVKQPRSAPTASASSPRLPDKTARIWDAATGKPIGEPLKGHDLIVSSAAFSPDGKRIVTASADKTARIWDAATGKPIGEPLKGHDDRCDQRGVQPRRQAHRHRVCRQDGAHLGRRDRQADRRAAQGP